MAQLLLAGVQLVCQLPAARIIGPPIAAIIPLSPLNVISFLVWLLCLKFIKTKGKTRTWRQAALWATLGYFCTMIPLYFIIFLVVCRAV